MTKKKSRLLRVLSEVLLGVVLAVCAPLLLLLQAAVYQDAHKRGIPDYQDLRMGLVVYGGATLAQICVWVAYAALTGGL